jgi:integrase
MEGKWKKIANEDEDIVFIAVKSGGPLDSGRIYTAFQRAAKLIGIEGFSPHSLRHSAATFLHRQRAPVKTISVYLGHADTRITDDVYTHLFQDELNEAAEMIEEGLDAAIEKHRKTGGSAL